LALKDLKLRLVRMRELISEVIKEAPAVIALNA
jgi:hypothetical protein